MTTAVGRDGFPAYTLHQWAKSDRSEPGMACEPPSGTKIAGRQPGPSATPLKGQAVGRATGAAPSRSPTSSTGCSPSSRSTPGGC